MKSGRKILVPILIVIIVILVGVILYALVIKPAINGYMVNAQNQGIQYAIYSIMQQAVQCQPSGVPLIFGNQTINIIAIECLQQTPEVNLS